MASITPLSNIAVKRSLQGWRRATCTYGSLNSGLASFSVKQKEASSYSSRSFRTSFKGLQLPSLSSSVRNFGPPLIVSGSDDGTVKLWDMRHRGCLHTFPDKYQITAIGFSDGADKIFTGGIDNDIKVWDLRKHEVAMKLQGHTETITSIQLSPDGSYLLTNSMDCTLRVWDMRPYAPQNRCVKILTGHQHNFEKNLLRCNWSLDGSKVTFGSADQMVYIWDTTSRRILYKVLSSVDASFGLGHNSQGPYHEPNSLLTFKLEEKPDRLGRNPKSY